MRRGRRGRPRGIGSVDELDSLECLVWLEDAQHFVPQLLVQHAQTVRSRLGAIDSGLETGELRQGRDARPRKALLYLKQELHWCIYEVLSEMGSKRRDGRQIEELAVGPRKDQRSLARASEGYVIQTIGKRHQAVEERVGSLGTPRRSPLTMALSRIKRL